MIFNIHARLMWEENKDARYIWDPYSTSTYYIFYLIKVKKLLNKKCSPY
jgi:hypothetical protein